MTTRRRHRCPCCYDCTVLPRRAAPAAATKGEPAAPAFAGRQNGHAWRAPARPAANGAHGRGAQGRTSLAVCAARAAGLPGKDFSDHEGTPASTSLAGAATGSGAIAHTRADAVAFPYCGQRCRQSSAACRRRCRCRRHRCCHCRCQRRRDGQCHRIGRRSPPPATIRAATGRLLRQRLRGVHVRRLRTGAPALPSADGSMAGAPGQALSTRATIIVRAFACPPPEAAAADRFALRRHGDGHFIGCRSL